MYTKTVIAFTIFIQFFSSGCNLFENKKEANKTKELEKLRTANVFIYDKFYVPEGIARNGMTKMHYSIPSKYVLIIKDDKNKSFEINDLNLWTQVEKGDSAIVTYNEVKRRFPQDDIWDLKFQKIVKIQ